MIILGIFFCGCVLMAYLVDRLIKKRQVAVNPYSDIFRKYEHSMERLVQLYRDDNENLMKEKDELRKEITALVSMFDTNESDDIEETDDEEDLKSDVVFTMEPAVETQVATLPSARLFRKIEAARKLVQHEAAFMPKETRAKLIALLTPENDVEAA